MCPENQALGARVAISRLRSKLSLAELTVLNLELQQNKRSR